MKKLPLLSAAPLALLIALAILIANAAPPIPLSQKQTVASSFNGAQSAHAADLDNDGDLDVIGAAATSNTVTWWENGNGWVAHPITTTFAGAINAVPADLDGDGDQDIVGAAQTADTIAWWENGNGWQSHLVDDTFNGVYDVQTADLDHDGDLDLLGAAFDGNEVAWWENSNGDGTAWTKETIDGSFGSASSVQTADLDHDGDLDVVGAAGSGNEIAWWENRLNTAQSWLKSTIQGSLAFAHWVDTGDVDDDGDMDVLGAILNDNDLIWWENNGSGGGWASHPVDTNFSEAHTVQADDVDGDGDLDVLGVALNADTVAWWENDGGGGTSWIKYDIDTTFNGAHSVEAADIDGDGDLDILGAARDGNEVAWWENGTIHRNALYPAESPVDNAVSGAYGVEAADLDMDGDMDMVGVAAGSGQVAWWQNTAGDGSAWSKVTVDGSFGGARAATTADVDGDGDLDVLASGINANAIAWWENLNGDGSSWQEHSVVNGFTGAFWVDAADIDRDGDVDVLGAAAFGGNTAAWFENMDGSGTSWSQTTLSNTFQLAVGIHAADVDGDGDQDILGASFGAFPSGAGGRVVWWENGAGWTLHPVDNSYLGAVGVYSGDVDGDGDIDVVGAANVDEEFTWWENLNGSGTSWNRQAVGSDFANAEGVYAADLDGDGDMDILGGSQIDNTVAWWENLNEDGATWMEHIVEDNFLEAVAVFAADMDGDGDNDIMAAGAVENAIRWWENVGGQFALETVETSPGTMPAGSQDDLLQVTAAHNGRPGDNDLELTSLALLFEEAAADPLSTAEANALIDNLYVYLDDGSGVFEAANDTLVTTVTTLSLSGGVQIVPFNDGDPNIQVAHGMEQSFFVVVALTADAHNQTPNSFTVTHLTEPTGGVVSEAEDATADTPLTLAYSENASAALVISGTVGGTVFLPVVLAP